MDAGDDCGEDSFNLRRPVEDDQFSFLFISLNRDRKPPPFILQTFSYDNSAKDV